MNPKQHWAARLLSYGYSDESGDAVLTALIDEIGPHFRRPVHIRLTRAARVALVNHILTEIIKEPNHDD